MCAPHGSDAARGGPRWPTTAGGADRVLAVAADVSTAEGVQQVVVANGRDVRRRSTCWSTTSALGRRRRAARHDGRRVAGGVRPDADAGRPRVAARRAAHAAPRRRVDRHHRVDLRPRGGRPHDLQRGQGRARSASASRSRSSWRRSNIRVNSVSPGSILFEGGRGGSGSRQDPAGIAEFVKREMPFGRFGRPEEVGDVVAFLASPRASWISGTSVVVDGCQSRAF